MHLDVRVSRQTELNVFVEQQANAEFLCYLSDAVANIELEMHGMQTKLQTEKYLVENPEHAEYLRRANRKPINLARVFDKAKFWFLSIICLVAFVWFGSSFRSSMQSTHYRTMHIGRILNSMIGELDQQEKVWAEID